jgi:hypothetical protein
MVAKQQISAWNSFKRLAEKHGLRIPAFCEVQIIISGRRSQRITARLTPTSTHSNKPKQGEGYTFRARKPRGIKQDVRFTIQGGVVKKATWLNDL